MNSKLTLSTPSFCLSLTNGGLEGDGGIAEGQLGKGGVSGNILCFSLIEETFRFTVDFLKREPA